MLYLGYVGFTVPFAFALGALIMKYPGEKWIQITRRWTMVTWCFLTIGVFLGAHWAYAVLGWGGYWGWDPGRKCLAHALAHRHGVSAFRHDAGKTRHVESLEHGADLRHLPALHARNLPHAFRRNQFRARLRAILDRNLVPGLHRIDPRGLHLLPDREPRSPEDRAQTRVAGFARIQFPVQQSSSARGLLHHSVGHVLPHHFRIRSRTQSHRRPAVLQSRCRPGRVAAHAAHRRWTAARLAQDVHRKPQAELPVPRHRLACRRRNDDRLRSPSLGRSFVSSTPPWPPFSRRW